MKDPKKSNVILLAEDDEDDYFFTKDALRESRLPYELLRVKDGEELMAYLLRQGSYRNAQESPRPGIVLLDLNMPKKDGRVALKEIKSNPKLCQIPVVVLATSQVEGDVASSYDLGANSFIRKRTSLVEFIHALQVLNEYWFGVVELPRSP
jgi:CheY-like chemotaxis protein